MSYDKKLTVLILDYVDKNRNGKTFHARTITIESYTPVEIASQLSAMREEELIRPVGVNSRYVYTGITPKGRSLLDESRLTRRQRVFRWCCRLFRWGVSHFIVGVLCFLGGVTGREIFYFIQNLLRDLES